MKRATGSGGVGLSYTEENYGSAYERACEESEMGLPVGFDDPNAYHGKTPPCDPIIGQ